MKLMQDEERNFFENMKSGLFHEKFQLVNFLLTVKMNSEW